MYEKNFQGLGLGKEFLDLKQKIQFIKGKAENLLKIVTRASAREDMEKLVISVFLVSLNRGTITTEYSLMRLAAAFYTSNCIPGHLFQRKESINTLYSIIYISFIHESPQIEHISVVL